VLVCAGLVLVGCSIGPQRSVPRTSGPTPEAVVLQHVPHLATPRPQNVVVQGRLPVGDGVAVLYTVGNPDDTFNGYSLGVVLTEQRDGAWHVAGSTYGSDGRTGDALLDYRSTALFGRDAALLYGYVFDPQVAAIKATFDNGETLRTDVGGPMFGSVAPGAVVACEVRALNAAGQVLQQFDLTTGPHSDPNAEEQCDDS
jgi:hypothetical protein